jgi:hypothetical protein
VPILMRQEGTADQGERQPVADVIAVLACHREAGAGEQEQAERGFDGQHDGKEIPPALVVQVAEEPGDVAGLVVEENLIDASEELGRGQGDVPIQDGTEGKQVARPNYECARQDGQSEGCDAIPNESRHRFPITVWHAGRQPRQQGKGSGSGEIDEGSEF